MVGTVAEECSHGSADRHGQVVLGRRPRRRPRPGPRAGWPRTGRHGQVVLGRCPRPGPRAGWPRTGRGTRTRRSRGTRARRGWRARAPRRRRRRRVPRWPRNPFAFGSEHCASVCPGLECSFEQRTANVRAEDGEGRRRARRRFPFPAEPELPTLRLFEGAEGGIDWGMTEGEVGGRGKRGEKERMRGEDDDSKGP